MDKDINKDQMTTLEELAGMKMDSKMRRLFIELFKAGKAGKLKSMNLNKESEKEE